MEDSQKNALPEKESSHSPLQLVEFEGTQTPRTITQVTPNGSMVWIPHCDLDKKPIGEKLIYVEVSFDAEDQMLKIRC
ncbi:unnamed protein product [Amaranthus hypochondriacus]